MDEIGYDYSPVDNSTTSTTTRTAKHVRFASTSSFDSLDQHSYTSSYKDDTYQPSQTTTKNEELQALFQRIVDKTKALKMTLDEEKRTIKSLEVSLVEEKTRNESLKEHVNDMRVARIKRRRRETSWKL